MPYFKLKDGVKIFYEQYGQEEDFNLIFFHGWGVSSVWFSEIIPFISSNGYRITIFDFPGHGKFSDSRTTGYTYEQMKEDFKIILNELNLNDKPIGLLGWSAGAGIIQRFYLEPEFKPYIKCLILIGGSYSIIDDPLTKTLWSSLLGPINLGFSPLLIFGKKRLIKRIAPLLALVWKKPKRSVSTWLHDLLLLKRDVITKELKELLKFNLKYHLSDILVPTLIIAGKIDVVTPVKDQEIMHSLIPNSELHLIKNTGHLILVTHDNEINPIIVNFLKKHGF
ncbi:MAG: alpha/beta fold hydrolase [Candidatus Helarchaeota archaeon]